MQRQPTLVAIALTLVLAVHTPAAHAQTVLAQHQGAADPTAQGWVVDVDSGGIAQGVIDDAAAAWSVVDANTAGDLLYYRADLDPDDLAAGWTMTARVRVNRAHDTAFGSAFFGVNTGGVSYLVYFGSRDGSTLELRPFDLGSNLTFAQRATGYVDLRLAQGGSSGAVSLWLDETLVTDQFAGYAIGSPVTQALWGVGSSAQVGGANFSLVQVTAVPEPGTWALWVGGLGALATLRRRRRT